MAAAGAVPLQAAEGQAPSLADSFRIGNRGQVCEAQGISAAAGRRSVYDRRWALLCREVARPVGMAAFVRDGSRPAPGTGLGEELDCTGPAAPGPLGAQAQSCRGRTSGLAYRSYVRTASRGTWVVEGLEAYDSALQLALASLAEDRLVPGEVTAASLGSGGGNAFFQAKAGLADADSLIGQGYRRNAAGAYAESAQLFSAVAGEVGAGTADSAARRHERIINQALQLSNLGQFDQAAKLFGEAHAMPGIDPVQARLARNFEAIDALNRRDLAAVPEILARPMPSSAAGITAGDGAVTIDAATAQGLGTGTAADMATIMGVTVKLTPAERAEIADAQADAIAGTAQRMAGRSAEARSLLTKAEARAAAVRDGRVISVTRLRAQILSEIGESNEAAGDLGAAERLYREAEALVATQYPDSASVGTARARLAGFLIRHGRTDEARGLYRGLVSSTIGSRDALVGVSNLIRPWFDHLVSGGATSPQDLSDLLLASQLVERPGAAETLSQLARELEGGSDEASALFRRSLATSRDLERNRVQQARLSGLNLDRTALAGEQAALAAEQARLEAAQVQLASALSAFPRYRAVARGYVTLDELHKTLRPGEAYLKLVTLGERTYAVLVTPTGGRGWRIGKSSAELADLVSTLRDSISVTVNGVRSTYPFDLAADAALSDALLGPVRGDLAGTSHLVFEPDGAMLQLPLNLLLADSAGVDAYNQRVAAGGDEFDMRGIGWLGRKTAVSTALSAASFRDARAAPPSHAGKLYLGLGQNQPLGAVSQVPTVRGAAQATGFETGCDWPVATWNQPVSAAELTEAAGLFGSGRSALLTGAAFTDSAVEQRSDLSDYRVVHFATHGLVTAPRAGCPARPALLTSFGGGDSDGLLRFDEIFALKLDADLVILSACDTAGGASLEATREAGVSSGGGQALDGLVRAFIAAGGRQVIASHWPAPDDFRATERLIGGFFAGQGAGAGESVAGALQRSQVALMDDADTSHPFYWAGFAIIGDGERPLQAR
ncbi:CHAT domain-containing protein [Novosphingobium flavum]|uniref:CHAT domain-containing protein n=2 Tax=Novosphingobium flavum TaxID=1778672 RepID=A0A7X1FNQ4_9SPHN|nr:CHAT domain-containing protein [Novosphingobium flavum]